MLSIFLVIYDGWNKTKPLKSISLVKIDADILNKILTSQDHQYVQRILHHGQEKLFQECQLGLTYKSHSM